MACPQKTLFSFSGGRRWTATGVLFSRRGPDEGLLPTRPLTNCLRRKTAGWPFMNSFLAPLLLPRGRAAIIPPCVSLRREFGNCEPLRPKQKRAAWALLRDRRLGAKFRRQFRIENRVLDFYCFEHRLAIELDGGVHSQIDRMRKDAAKEDYLRTLGIRLLRIPNAMVLEHADEFVRVVVEAMRLSAEKARK